MLPSSTSSINQSTHLVAIYTITVSLLIALVPIVTVCCTLIPLHLQTQIPTGFTIGTLRESYRIFIRASVQRADCPNASQDGSREGVTLIATICADGTSVSPCLIFGSNSGDIQST